MFCNHTLFKKPIDIHKAWIRLGLALCMLFGFAMQVANSHSNATGMVKERMDFMKDLGKASKSIAKMIKGQTRYDAEQLASHAQQISNHSKKLLDYFPQGSLQKPTEALPRIWENWDDFQNRNETFQMESEKLMSTIDQGDKKAIAKQFTTVGKSCKSCHQDYRKKEKS